MFSYNYPHIVFSLPMSVPLGFLDFSPFLLSYSFNNKRNEFSISMNSANRLQMQTRSNGKIKSFRPLSNQQRWLEIILYAIILKDFGI